MKAIVVRQYGGPDVLWYEEVTDPELKPERWLLKVRVAGFNYAEVMMRRGLYRGGPQPPYIPGFEVCGTVGRRARDGLGSQELRQGDSPPGVGAERRCRLPCGLSRPTRGVTLSAAFHKYAYESVRPEEAQRAVSKGRAVFGSP